MTCGVSFLGFKFEVSTMTDSMTAEARKDYPKWLTQELNTQRADNRFCDVILKCGTQEFPAHRNVLCAASSYFNSLLDGGFTESAQQVIDVTNSFPNPEILEPILKYIYTGELNIKHVDHNTVGDLLEAVSFLLLDDAKNIIIETLTDSLVLSNCVEILTLASRCNIKHLAELSAQIIESRTSDILHHGETLYDLEPKLLFNLLDKPASGFQHLSDTDALCFLKKYIREWLSNHEEDGQLLTSLKNVVKEFCLWYVTDRDDMKCRDFWTDLLQIFNDENEEEQPDKILRNLERVLSLEDNEISDEAKFDRMADEQNDILVLRTEKKKAADSQEPEIESFYAYETITDKWVKLFERQKIQYESDFYSVLGICNDFLIMGDRYAKMSNLVAFSLSEESGEINEIRSAHVMCAECNNDLDTTICRAQLFVAENSIFCIDPVPCCNDEYEDHVEQTIGYVLKKYNWNTSDWETCGDIPIPENFDLNPQVLDTFYLEHRDMRFLVNTQCMTAVKGSEIVTVAYKYKSNDDRVIHFSVTTLKMNQSTGSYDSQTVSIGELDWGGIDMNEIEPSEFCLWVCEGENHIKVVLLAEEYDDGKVATWTIETRAISENEMSSLPRNLIRAEVRRMSKPRCGFGMGLQ